MLMLLALAFVGLMASSIADSGGTVTVLSPDGDEILEGGSVQSLEFDTSSPGGEVRLALSLDGGGTYPIVLGSMPNAGGRQTFNWTVPTNVSSLKVRARAVWLAGNATNLTVVASDASDADLAIRQPGQGEETGGGWNAFTWALLALICVLLVTGVAAYTVMWRRGERPEPKVLLDERLGTYRGDGPRAAGQDVEPLDEVVGPSREDADPPP
jgi:hypothetical protein